MPELGFEPQNAGAALAWFQSGSSTIPYCTTPWFQSYLCARQQRVVTHTGTSPLVAITSGVPQGTILGPVLFNIYVRKLPLTAEAFSCKLPMFADDMTLYASRRTQAEAVATVTDSLSAISVDLDELGLRINTTKTVTNYFDDF